MSFSSIFYIIGILLTAFGVFMVVPGFVSLGYEEPHGAFPFFVSSGFTIFIGMMLFFMNRHREQILSHRDGFLITFLTWATLSFAGAWPLYLTGAAPTFIDAFFEAVSGLTTTGATVMNGLDGMAHSILLWRSMLQWIGGMGIVVLAVAILPFLGIGGMQMYRAEMPGVVKDKLQPRLKETAKLLWMVYFTLTCLCTLGYKVAGMHAFDAINHAFTTVATGGFSTHDSSFAYFNNPMIEVVAILFMLIGGINFSLHYLFINRLSFGVYLRNVEFRFFFTILFIALVLVFSTVTVMDKFNLIESIRYTLFNTISILTTTGYGNADYNSWASLAPMVLFTLMFIGGCSGSTSGGMKVLRIMMIIKQGARELARLVHPRGIVHVKVGRQTIPDEVMQAVWSFAGLYIVFFALFALVVAAYGIDLITAFSAAAATLTGVGPGLGEVGPMGNYGILPLPVKALLCVSMIMGRLELFTLLVILTPRFWRK